MTCRNTGHVFSVPFEGSAKSESLASPVLLRTRITSDLLTIVTSPSSVAPPMVLGRRKLMRLLASYPSAIPAPLERINFSTVAASSKWECGVSMVQGASRGIGLEFVRQLLQRSDNGHVVATCRDPSKSSGLISLKNEFAERLSIFPLDVADENTIMASAKAIKDQFGSLNLLVNASGILSIPNVLQPETTLLKVEKSSLLMTYEINAVGPILVIKHMWPLLKAGGGGGMEREVSVVANISARVGSIGDNQLGGWHSYRSSKAALNQLTKTVSVEFARKKDPIICILLHPGTVDTDLSKPFQSNVPQGKLFTKEFSVQRLLRIIDNAKRGDNGKFFAWDGQEIVW